MSKVDFSSPDDPLIHVLRNSETRSFASIALSSIIANAWEYHSQQELDIASHYVSESKYGLAGSNGTLLSNYVRYTLNNHELLAILCADFRNPFTKGRRMLVLLNKYALSFLLTAAGTCFINNEYFEHRSKWLHLSYYKLSIAVALITIPYGIILKQLATCQLARRSNFCVKNASTVGVWVLIFLASFSVFYIAAGCLIAYYFTDNRRFLSAFGIAILYDFASYFYFGIWNWLLASWSGFLFFPQIPCVCGLPPFPPKLLPLLGCGPLNWLLRYYGMGERTYLEDKMRFQIAYPERIAIDKRWDSFCKQ